MSVVLALYRGATRALEPLAPVLLRARVRRGKESAARLGERLGAPGVDRPHGALCWLHGASVGETLSVLPLVEALQAARPELSLLVTSATLTSAELLAERLPPGVIHQFAPVDAPRVVSRFLAHWRPDLAVFIESELWPNLLLDLQSRRIPTALVSARLSDASLKGWGRAPAAARTLLNAFSLVMAQEDATAQALVRLGARDDGRLNLKLAGDPLGVDAAALRLARETVGERPVLLAASTHAGEDALALEVFAWLKDRPDRPLLVLVPRHTERGESVIELARGYGFIVSRQAAGEPITPADQVYVADVMGELGLWFRLARIALIGGSLVEGVGGHNPLEAARLECPVVAGAHVENWRAVYRALEAAAGVRTVSGAAGLAAAFAEALTDPHEFQAQAGRARLFAESQTGEVDSALDRLLVLLDQGQEAL